MWKNFAESKYFWPGISVWVSIVLFFVLLVFIFFRESEVVDRYVYDSGSEDVVNQEEKDIQECSWNVEVWDECGGWVVYYVWWELWPYEENALIAHSEDQDNRQSRDLFWETITWAHNRTNGLENTKNLVEEQSDAALSCYEKQVGDYDDWYLPSARELDTLHQHSQYWNNMIENFTPYRYWSSTEETEENAYMIYFSEDEVEHHVRREYNKRHNSNIRCIRAVEL